MNCTGNDPQEIDVGYQGDRKQQVAATNSDSDTVAEVGQTKRSVQSSNYYLHQHQRPEDVDEVDGWTTGVNAVKNREKKASHREPSLPGDTSSSVVDETEYDTEPGNHVGASSGTISLTADGNGEVAFDAEATTKEAEEESRRRGRNCTMRDPQESHHRPVAPLGEVESGEDSDCVVVASSERKVEPLKINLARDREPIRTIIKLTPGAGSVVDHHSSCSQPLSPTIREVPGSPKITIKPPKPPALLEPYGGPSSSSSVGGSNQNSNSILSTAATATTAMSPIPKLTIKPVVNPLDDLLAGDPPTEQMQIIPKLLIKGSSLEATGGGSLGREGVTEPHIVPKLTIRGVNNHNHHLHHHHHHQHYQHHPFVQVQPEFQHYSTNSTVLSVSQSDGSGSGANAIGRDMGSPTTPVTPLVPKLTIKMDNNHPHHHHHIQQPQQQNSLRLKEGTDAGGGPGGSGNRIESPIPKLHIKAILPEGGLSAQPPPSGVAMGTNAGVHSASGSGNSYGATAGSPPVLTSSEGVKLTIKPLPEPPKLPKLTIKTTGLGTIAETSDASLVSSTSCSFSPKPLPPAVSTATGDNPLEVLHHQIQYLNAAQQQPASPSDQHSNISSSSIPKLTIKPLPPKVGGVVGQLPSPAGGTSQVSMAGTASAVDQPPTVPKLTIKPIPPPMKQSTGEDSNSSSETSINSLESSPVSSSSSSLSVTSAVITTSPSALRMTIKVPPQQEHNSSANASGSASLSGVLTSSSSVGSVVTKLNIKPILPPPSPSPGNPAGKQDSLLFTEGVDISRTSSMQSVVVSGDGDSTPPSEAEVDPSAPIVIPKVTIKTLANPRGQETEIMSTPKVTLRPIPKPTAPPNNDSLPGSPGGGHLLERHSPKAIGSSTMMVTNNSTGHAHASTNNSSSPTTGMTASDGSGAMDSPRIILKINKGSSSLKSTSMEQQQQQPEGMATAAISVVPGGGSSILANELKRSATTGASGSGTTFSSSSSSSLSSVSCASSTSVSVSTTSSSAGSDPASPSSSGGGGDQVEPGSPEAKKSKLDPVTSRTAPPQQQFSLHSEHNAALRQSLLQNHHHQQLQFQHQKATMVNDRPEGASGSASRRSAVVVGSDVIVIDDDSKSENESMREAYPRTTGVAIQSTNAALPDAHRQLAQQPFYGLMSTEAAGVIKQRRSRGTPRGRGGGGRQSRRGAAGGRGAALQQHVVAADVPRLIPALLNHDDHDEGSSSDCMIVDDPASTVAAGASKKVAGLSLENLLLGRTKCSPPPLIGGSSIYNAPSGGGVGGSSEVEKNGTASNSSIGSVASSIGGTIPAVAVAAGATPTSTTPGTGVRMSTRRGAGQLLKEVLANKHHDRDSGVDEAKTDGEGGLLQGGGTPSKRPRGRPKKQSVDLTIETNGGGSSSSMEGQLAADNMILAMAMMGGRDVASFLRPDGAGMLGSHPLMEGIMPLPVTPVRTPRTRGRGRGRGRGKLLLPDGANVAGSPTTGPYDVARTNFGLSPGGVTSEGNGDPLFIDAASNFNLLFNHVQTPRGGRTRGGRRGPGSRGPRTPRGGGRGAKAAMIATLLATQSMVGFDGSCSVLDPSQETTVKGIVDPLQSSNLSVEGSPSKEDTPAATKRRARAPRGTGPASKRKAAQGRKAPRGKKAQEAAALLAAGELMNAVDNPSNANNTIFMTPMAGGLDLNLPRLHIRELKTPQNAIKSNTPPSSSLGTPIAGTTPTGTPGPTAPVGLQVFEEDTRMSGDFNFTTPVRLMSSGDGFLQQNEESQSSYLSSTSVTQDATATSVVTANGGQLQSVGVADGGTPTSASTEALAGAVSTNSSSSSSRRMKGKMEVLDAHRAVFTVDLLAEYEWPPPSPGTRGTDTFMIQEQIAEYLGVKSFKRKYPDLMRRPVDMEERNFILEQGLASEKMCDLGLTAVYASEILDIMCTDYPQKYEEYTRYTREKHFRELSARQRQQQEAVSAVAAVPIDRAQLQKEKAIESAASWNCSFNRERRDTRRACMDLQTYVVQVPKRTQPSRLDASQQPTAALEQPSNYPVALVPGQFSEHYTTFTPEELACYPINTILLDPLQLKEIIASERYRKLVAAEEARLRACDGDSNSSSSDSSDDSSNEDSSSSSDEDEDGSSSSSTMSGGSSSSDSDDCDVKKELDRRKESDQADCETNDDTDTKPSTSAIASAPLRRSSRALSAGIVVPTVVECKDPTDSDDSDVPLIAHAAKRKNMLLSATAGSAATVSHPFAGGGKRMQETLSPVKRPPVDPFMCAVCLGPENKNKFCKPERFVRCNRCRRKAHPTCIGMSSVMYRRVQQYKWQCSECKLCMKCNRCPSALDSKMVYCDQCDRGYHLACKGLRNLPDGRWHCSICTICGQCGARTPEGHPNPHLNAQQRQHLAMVAEWTHEYGLNELTKIREHLRTLCVPCVRQRRQRLQHTQEQTQPTSAPVLNASGDTVAILNNNNNSSDHRKLQPVQQAGAGFVASATKPQSHVMTNNATIKKQSHSVTVQSSPAISSSHLPAGAVNAGEGFAVGSMGGVVRR